MTRVPAKAAWEYCIYVDNDSFGYYEYSNGQLTKYSMPFGLLAQQTFGDTGQIAVRISKQFFNYVPAIRYTISTFDPNAPSNPDSLFQGGSSACDVFPGTPGTFGGEINGYGEIGPLGTRVVTHYKKFYIYNGINPVVEFDSSGSILARYIYAGGRHISKIVGSDTFYYHCDALGSPRKMINELGTLKWQARYYPFGEMSESGFEENTHGFTGKEFDEEMDLNYFCQRYYDPEIGRFMRLDPFGGYLEIPQSQNRYAYCINNPLKYIDPLGFNGDYPDYGNLYDWLGPGWWSISGPGGWEMVLIAPGGNFPASRLRDLYYDPGEGRALSPIEGKVIGDTYYPNTPEPDRSQGAKLARPALPPILPPGLAEAYFWYTYGPNVVGFYTEANTTLNYGGVVGSCLHFGENLAPETYSYLGGYRGGNFGWSLGFYIAWGDGTFAGTFNNLEGTAGPFCASYFGSENWQGLSLGFGIGVPYGLTSGQTIFSPLGP